MWVFGGSGESAHKSNIEEANKHLAAMAQKIRELEKIVEDQKQEILEKDERATLCIKQLGDNHHTEVAELKSKIKDHLSTIRTLQGDVKRRDTELNILRQRARMLDEVMRYKASLAKLTITLEQAEQYSRSVAGRAGLNEPRLAVNGGTDSGSIAVYTEPSPRINSGTPSYYLVDEMPDEELIDRVGETYINGERKKANEEADSAKQNRKPTLIEKVKAKEMK
ncbi:Vimentin-type intermediate filament-associated coiled-coil protein [Echinococcus granulosus]|uniref:Vimentin type intermediate filament associated n=1 Tax=Echinococcus granulosus TaxID=6210 RepID=U6J6C0_ECHGR|nr:Vimentin-type intermediate filament-associated coiled-coil protein [Echinococcus granulosus]EUB56615.1 Vimentin-type intermediate filament-associated coiled-coil protein [Echinococcus granulosus]KAH9280465.1 Vimentin-type intermediate filament-associated coiled-coil protein [Echinococcus granulosus]CDS19639.1 vimentin type intermediate filament associated [Echinococcus granulosus]